MQKTNCACRLAGSACRRATAVGRQGGKDLLPIMVLVGQQPDLAALLPRSARSAQHEQGLSRHLTAQLVRSARPLNPEPLCEDEQRPGRAGGLPQSWLRQWLADAGMARGELRPAVAAAGLPAPASSGRMLDRALSSGNLRLP
jgi:hypothetical protein